MVDLCAEVHQTVATGHWGGLPDEPLLLEAVPPFAVPKIICLSGGCWPKEAFLWQRWSERSKFYCFLQSHLAVIWPVHFSLCLVLGKTVIAVLCLCNWFVAAGAMWTLGSCINGLVWAFLFHYLDEPGTLERSTGLKYRMIFLLVLSKDNKWRLPVQFRGRIEKGQRKNTVLIAQETEDWNLSMLFLAWIAD